MDEESRNIKVIVSPPDNPMVDVIAVDRSRMRLQAPDGHYLDVTWDPKEGFRLLADFSITILPHAANVISVRTNDRE